MEGGSSGGHGSFLPNSSFGAFSETATNMDFMDELFFDGCWLETTDGKSLKQTAYTNIFDVQCNLMYNIFDVHMDNI